MRLCKTVRLTFENGEVRDVLINRGVANEEIEEMGMGQYFNLGLVEDDVQKCINVEIIE